MKTERTYCVQREPNKMIAVDSYNLCGILNLHSKISCKSLEEKKTISLQIVNISLLVCKKNNNRNIMKI